MSEIRYDWTKEEIKAIYDMPFMELIYKAATVHRENHNPNEVQVSSLISIKTGGCSEDCGYCPQAARYHTDIDKNDLMSVNQVTEMVDDCMEDVIASVIDDWSFEEIVQEIKDGF